MSDPKNATGLENEVGTPRQLLYAPNKVRGSYICMFLEWVQAERIYMNIIPPAVYRGIAQLLRLQLAWVD